MDKQYLDLAPVSSYYSRAVRVVDMFFIVDCAANDSPAEHEGPANYKKHWGASKRSWGQKDRLWTMWPS